MQTYNVTIDICVHCSVTEDYAILYKSKVRVFSRNNVCLMVDLYDDVVLCNYLNAITVNLSLAQVCVLAHAWLDHKACSLFLQIVQAKAFRVHGAPQHQEKQQKVIR